MPHRIHPSEKPGEFCVTVLLWTHPDGTTTPITEVYTGPEEASAYGPTWSHDYGWDLYDAGTGHILVVRTWRTWNDGNDCCEYTGLAVHSSSYDDRAWTSSERWGITRLLGGRTYPKEL